MTQSYQPISGCKGINPKKYGSAGNGVQVHSVTTEAKVQIPVAAKPHLLEYMDLQMEVLDEERLQNDVDAY